MSDTIRRVLMAVGIDGDGNETLLGPEDSGGCPVVWFSDATTAEYVAALPRLAAEFGKTFEIREYVVRRVIARVEK